MVDDDPQITAICAEVLSNQGFDGATRRELDPFYVLAPQTSAAQGYPPNTFAHDHVVRDIPAGNGGTFSVRLQGIFVLCSGQGIVSDHLLTFDLAESCTAHHPVARRHRSSSATRPAS